jgi:transposase
VRDVVMIHDLKKQGLSDTAIGRQLGISRRTVARRLKQELAVPVYGPRPPKPRLIEPFEAYLQDRVQAWPDLSARRLFREIKERGYRGGYSMVTAFLRDVRPPSVQLYERRYETLPGKQAQADFAYFEVEFTDAPGVKQVVWLFTMVLGHSRYLWGRFCPNQKLALVLRCHIDAFAELGGVPQEILYDRMKTVVIGADAEGAAIYNASLIALAGHYAYQPRACRPYRAKTKGKVERPYRYIRQDFFLARSFRNLDDLNRQFSVWLAEQANARCHAGTKRIVAEAFAEEKLQALPAMPYSAAITVERRISRDGMVSVDGNLYSVPDSTRRRTVEVQVSPKDIRIFEAGQCIAQHPVLTGKNQARLDPGHRLAPPKQQAIEITAAEQPLVSNRPLAFYDAVAQRLAAETVLDPLQQIAGGTRP